MPIMSNINGRMEIDVNWSIATAKQQFSEVVRLTAEEPQAIYNRSTPVAVLISAQDFADFQRWRTEHNQPTLEAQFNEIRALLAADGMDEGLEIPPRQDRPSPFDDPNWDA